MRQFKVVPSITSRDSEAVKLFLRDISRYSVPSVDEEVELAKKIKAGDEAAFNELVVRNLRFVVSVAKKFDGLGMPFADLIAEGTLGLMDAARRFDETRGFKFASYAVWWINQAITKALCDTRSAIRLPGNKRGMLNKIFKARERFFMEHGMDPTAEDLAEITRFDVEQIEESMYTPAVVSSLDKSFSDDNDNSLLDVMPAGDEDADQGLMDESMCIGLQSALKRCTERERIILTMTFGLDGNGERTLDEIGKMLDITRERVRQIKEKALRRLKNSSAAIAELRDFAA